MTDVAAIGQKLLRASAQNDLEQLDSALRGASPDYANGIGQTGLHVASIHGHVEVVKRLLKAGALVSSTNRYGVTPLHYAADSGRIEVARLLIEAGANKRTRASNGKLPVDMIKEDADCAEELQALLGSGSNKLHRAIKGHNLALLRQLLEAGKEDLSAVDSRGRSPFHLAALAAVTSTEDREQFNSSMAALQALVLAAKARGGEDKARADTSETLPRHGPDTAQTFPSHLALGGWRGVAGPHGRRPSGGAGAAAVQRGLPRRRRLQPSARGGAR